MKMHFIDSETETAQAALAELSALYGQNPWREAEVVVALGGDGLMLSVMHQNKGLPIYGMNRGTVGFMMNDYVATDLPAAIAALLAASPQASMSTAAHPITDWADMRNPNVVKVVCDARQLALYFSRAPIPWWRDGYADADPDTPAALSAEPQPLRHIGIYAYRAGFLRQFPALPQAPIETCESLEQLRALWHGHRIAVHITPDAPGTGVDTPEDLERVRALLAG